MFQSFPSSSSTNYQSSSSSNNVYDLPSYFASYSHLQLQTHTKQMQGHEAEVAAAVEAAAAAAAGGQASRYSPEERKERIERYRSKRNLRNFQKKITYECRKTLADSRPRVRGRFAKNAETESETDTAESSNGSYYSQGNNGNADHAWWHMEPDLITQDQFQAQSQSQSLDAYYDEDLWAHLVSDFSANI
ncbi:uncharacterized protein LOC144566020 [Carex rostrata]